MSTIPHYKFDSDIKLFNLADIHRGHPNCDVRFFHQIIDKIASDDKAYWVSTGDLGEVATKESKGDVYSTLSPQEELDIMDDELSPISDKCLGFVYSNHHKRTYGSSGLSFDKALSRYLQVPYLGKTGYLALTIGRGTYYVVMHHGVGGGTIGNKKNRARQLSLQRPGGDLYLTGHTHSYDAFPIWQKYIDRKRNIQGKFRGWHQITGHFIEYDDTYADMMMLEEQPVCCGMVELGYCTHGRYSEKKINPVMVTPE